MATVSEYLANVPAPQRVVFERIRKIVMQIVPDAEEALSYGMPAFKYKKRPLIGFTANKNHLAVYPFSPPVIEASKEVLDGYELSKGTVRFTLENPITDKALKQMIKLRSAEISGSK